MTIMADENEEYQKANLTTVVKEITDEKFDAINERLNSLEDSVRNTLDILVSGTEVKLTYPTEHTDIKILKS
ncbi:hypothetical protein [Vibrio metschnikovii]|uniref:hypothetical protein n=1 Tax=Vibrio metschnikovii TaxID=28172 RepID=UPI001C3069AA|nr:hypothetical protein [Vibrio metschnikovii]